MKTNKFTIGYDYTLWSSESLRIKVYSPIFHQITVGQSNSGKSTALLWWLRNLKKSEPSVEFWICDFKKSGEFEGITDKFADFENCYDLIKAFYKEFLDTPEGAKIVRLLIIDEIAGLLTHLSLTKQGKEKAEEIRQIMSSILMLGRSRNCYLWLVMQRYTASIFPSASGAADNANAIGLGRLSVDSRRGLFAGEHIENEEKLIWKQGTGIALLDGQPLRAIIIPRVSKSELLCYLQQHQ